MKIDVLISHESSTPEQRWTLASSLYEQQISLIQLNIVFFATLIICYIYTGLMIFNELNAAGVVILLGRLYQRRCFMNARPEADRPGRRTPEAWAVDFAVGASLSATLWGVTSTYVLLSQQDIALQFFVLMVQTGWLSAKAMRNAASPLVVYSQLMLTMVPTLVALVMIPTSFVQVLIPFILTRFVVSIDFLRYHSGQFRTLIDSEQRLSEVNAQLEALSNTDGLTGIGNRRAFDQRLVVEWGRAVRERAAIAIALIDVDHFKRYNDHYGHVSGDVCLRQVAAMLAGAIGRSTDLAARYGGEEFVALLPATDEAGARVVAEGLLRSLEILNLPHEESPIGHVSVSIGIVSLKPTAADEPESLITLADRALYHAKRSGRNQVRTASEAPADAGTETQAGFIA